MRIQNTIRRLIWIVPMLICTGWVLASVGAASDEADDRPKFGPWSAPVNLGPPVNGVNADYQPFISKDGLSLYFAILEGPTPNSPQDIWVAKRNAKSDPWGTPERLGAGINTTSTEGNPFITTDGHWMYFNSNRNTPDANGVLPFGGNDIYISHRQNKREDSGPSGWQEPVNAGPGVNSSSGEQMGCVFEDDSTGITTLFFNSNRSGNQDIYASTLQPDGTFGQPQRVTELNTPATEQQVTISRDGLEMYFTSDRPGSTIGPDGKTSLDIWVSTRGSTSDPWGTPQNLDVVNQALGGPAINSPFHDGRPSLSFDGETLYFFSAFREGNQSAFFDIWQTTRNSVKEQD